MTGKPFINRVKIFRDYMFRKTEVSSLPVEYVIEVSGVCNLRCPMCPCTILQKDTERGMMGRSTLKTIVSKIKNYAGFVFLIGRGEPLLNPDFIKLVKICKM